jgi:hypothetical protein
MPPKRPFSVTLLLYAVLSLTVWGAIRFTAALRWWDVLYEFDARLSPMYLAISGAAWGVAGGILLWSLARRKAWTRIAAPASVCAWQAQLWLERIFFESRTSNLPFSITVSFLIIVTILVISLRSSTRLYLTRSEDHEQPDQYSKIA